MKVVAALLAFLLLSSTASPRTIYVPTEYATITEAIAVAALNGDTIIVKPGVYMERFAYGGKNINIMSEQGPEVTTIDGVHLGTVVNFNNKETSAAIIDGFTITNGYASQGAGVGCSGASPIIRNNIITGNAVWSATVMTYGGGIYVYTGLTGSTAAPTITNNIITNNTASWFGAGICVSKSNPVITGNIIEDNVVDRYGGGICCLNSSASPVITDNIIRNNRALLSIGSGAGILCFETSNPVIAGNTIEYNQCGHTGGGLYCLNSTPSVTDNVISGNVATRGGGIYCGRCSPVISGNVIVGNGTHYPGSGAGIFTTTSTARIVNNVVSDNTSSMDGGAFYFQGGAPVVIGNKISRNTAARYGGALIASSSAPDLCSNTLHDNVAATCGGGIYGFMSDPVVANSILWANNATTGPEAWIGATGYAGSLTISYSDVQGGQGGIYVASGCSLAWGDGMIDSDPLLAQPDEDDLHLTRHSPCCNAGDNSGITELEDVEGDQRIEEDVVDIGADEYHFHLYSVGRVTTGHMLDLRVVGGPGMPVLLAHSETIQTPPESTPYGDLYLTTPYTWSMDIGYIPYAGIAHLSLTVPPAWASGELKYFQALVGSPGGPFTELTNLLTIEVE